MTKSLDPRAKQIKAIKAKSGMSQESLARKIGVSTQTIHRWLTGKSNPLVYLHPILDKFITENI